MRIAICEDDRTQAAQMAQFVNQHPYSIECQVFYSAEELLAAYAVGQRFDVVFVDIQMEGQTGFDTAKTYAKNIQIRSH